MIRQNLNVVLIFISLVDQELEIFFYIFIGHLYEILLFLIFLFYILSISSMSDMSPALFIVSSVICLKANPNGLYCVHAFWFYAIPFDNSL